MTSRTCATSRSKQCDYCKVSARRRRSLWTAQRAMYQCISTLSSWYSASLYLDMSWQSSSFADGQHVPENQLPVNPNCQHRERERVDWREEECSWIDCWFVCSTSVWLHLRLQLTHIHQPTLIELRWGFIMVYLGRIWRFIDELEPNLGSPV